MNRREVTRFEVIMVDKIRENTAKRGLQLVSMEGLLLAYYKRSSPARIEGLAGMLSIEDKFTWREWAKVSRKRVLVALCHLVSLLRETGLGGMSG